MTEQASPQSGDAAIDEMAPPKPSNLSGGDGKIDVECPGCRNNLRVRPQYIGSAVMCRHCGVQFVVSKGSDDGTPRGIPESNIGSRREEELRGSESEAHGLEINHLAEQLGKIQARLVEIDSEKIARNASLERAATAVEEQRSEVAALRERIAGFEGQGTDIAALLDRIAALHVELESVRSRYLSVTEDDRRAFAAEIEARGAADRQELERQLGLLRDEVEQLRKQNGELMRRGIEAEERSLGLQTHFDRLEEAPRPSLDQVNQLQERFRTLEESGIESAAAIRRELAFLTEQNRSLVQLDAEHREELQNGLETLQAGHASIQTALSGHEESRRLLEQGMASLQSALDIERRHMAEQSDDFEASSAVLRDEIERVHTSHRQVAEAHGGLLKKLAPSLDRLDALGSEGDAFRRDLESLRSERDAMRKEFLDQLASSRREIGELRAELEAQKVALSAKALPDLKQGPSMEPRSPTTPPTIGPAVALPRVEWDLLAHDLAREQTARNRDRSGAQTQAVIPPMTFRNQGPAEAPSSTFDVFEYRRLGEHFLGFMKEGKYADAIVIARRLVTYSRDQIGETTIEQALWLRNLSWGLSRVGGMDEARDLLHRALNICLVHSKVDQLPYVMCLLDLAEFYLASGDRQTARIFCEQSMAILRTGLGASGPLWTRAQKCMAGIGEVDTHLSVMHTTSIST